MRDIRRVAFLSIWDAAVEELRRANQWVFWGYSLPSEDVAIRTMLVRALLTRSRPPAIVVVERPLGSKKGDGDASLDRNALRARYRVLLGSPQFWPIGMDVLTQRLVDR